MGYLGKELRRSVTNVKVWFGYSAASNTELSERSTIGLTFPHSRGPRGQGRADALEKRPRYATQLVAVKQTTFGCAWNVQP